MKTAHFQWSVSRSVGRTSREIPMEPMGSLVLGSGVDSGLDHCLQGVHEPQVMERVGGERAPYLSEVHRKD